MASAGQGARSQLGKAAFCLSCQSAGWRHGCLFNYHHHHHHHRHTDSNKKAEMPPSRPTGRPRPTSAIADQQPDSGESLERVAVCPSQTLAGSPTASGGSKKHACQPATTTTATDSNKKAELSPSRQTDGPFLTVYRQSSWTRLSITAGQV